MKKYLIISISICFFLTGCKKDYPDDIPPWVKNMIREFKRSGKSHQATACGDCPVLILEYKETSVNQKLYSIQLCDPTYDYLYSDKGDPICNIELWNCNGPNGCNCGPYNSKNIVFVRKIWQAHCQ